MPIFGAEEIKAYLGNAIGEPGADGTEPTPGAGAFIRNASDEEATIVTQGVYVAAPGTWISTGLDWTADAAGVATYNGAAFDVFNVLFQANVRPVSGTDLDLRVTYLLNGTPAAAFAARATCSTGIWNLLTGIVRVLVVPTFTFQLAVANFDGTQNIEIQNARTVIM